MIYGDTTARELNILNALIADKPDIFDQPAKFKNILQDLFYYDPKIKNLLMIANEAGLLKSISSNNQLNGFDRDRYINVLISSYGIASDNATWVVDLLQQVFHGPSTQMEPVSDSNVCISAIKEVYNIFDEKTDSERRIKKTEIIRHKGISWLKVSSVVISHTAVLLMIYFFLVPAELNEENIIWISVIGWISVVCFYVLCASDIVRKTVFVNMVIFFVYLQFPLFFKSYQLFSRIMLTFIATLPGLIIGIALERVISETKTRLSHK